MPVAMSALMQKDHAELWRPQQVLGFPEWKQLQMHGEMDTNVGFTSTDMRIVSGMGVQCDHCTDQCKTNVDR